MVNASDILGARILVVDDQAANVVLLQRMLAAAGYTSVASTMDPREVCELHRRHRYDLILLDLQMPGMDGFQVMDALKDLESDSYLPVLAVTAQPGHELRALRHGARDFVSKPFGLAEVLMRVRNMLEVRLLHEESRRTGKALEALALQDPLTGLANRRSLDERMRIGLLHARINGSGMAVMCLDLDGFKMINDTFGHGAGDAVLKTVADRLVAVVRAEDTVARLGGDEFMIALWRAGSADGAGLVAAKVIEAVARPHDIAGASVSLTTSVGLSMYPTHGEDATALLQSADRALYDAKQAGKNVYRLAASADQGALALARSERRAAGTETLAAKSLQSGDDRHQRSATSATHAASRRDFGVRTPSPNPPRGTRR